MPNKELLSLIADKIEAEPSCYNQDIYYIETERTACGTVACIAGWAAKLGSSEPITTMYNITETAKRLLSINRHEAGILFHCDWRPQEGESVPQALRRIAETGVVK